MADTNGTEKSTIQPEPSDGAPAMKPDAGTAHTSVKLSLGSKISMILVGILLVLGGVTIWLVASQMQAALSAEFESKGVGIARSLATSSVDLLVEDNRTKVQGQIDEFKVIAGVKFIAIADPSGEVINHTITPDFPKELKDAIIEATEMTTDVEIAVHDIYIKDYGHILDISMPILNGALGTAHVGMDLDIIAADILALILKVVGVFVVFLLAGAGISYGFSRIIVRPLYTIVSVLEEVSRGNLQASTNIATRDELALLGGSVNRMIGALRDIVARVRITSVQVNDAAEEILATSETQEQGANEQRSSIEEISNSMNALSETAQAIASNADDTTGLAEEMSADVKVGQESLGRSRASMSQIVTHNELVYGRISSLYEQSQAIISVIDIIDSISDRLDLLALNAALEGSRAGEVGKGFSLVAQEMRRLAENVIGSTKEIKQTVQEIHSYTQSSLDASQQSTKTTSEGAEAMEQTVGVMQKIFESVDKTTDASRQITVITQQQLSSSEQMVGAMQEIASISTQGLSSSQQVTRAAKEMAELSASLRDSMSVFQIGDEHAAPELGAKAKGLTADSTAPPAS